MLTVSDLDYYDHVVARSDNGDGYDANGYVAVVKNGFAGISQYSHCSCYGTWEAISEPSGKNGFWDWEGTVEELVEIARRKADPSMPSRDANSQDYDYVQLIECYTEFLEWVEGQSKE